MGIAYVAGPVDVLVKRDTDGAKILFVDLLFDILERITGRHLEYTSELRQS